MKAILRLALIAFVLVPLMLFAQETKKSVLYLKNGSIIKGHIVDLIPDSTAKIQTEDGSIFVFKSADILRIQAEDAATEDSTKIKPMHGKKVKQHAPSPLRFNLSAGVAIPTGDIGDKNNGNAAIGVTINILLTPKKPSGILVDASYTSNGLQSGNSGHWTSIFLLGGYKIPFDDADEPVLSISPLLGVFVGTTPPLSDGYTVYDGATTYAFGYGVRLDIQATSSIYFAARYVGSNPTYKFDISGYNFEYKPSTGIFNVLLGVTF